MEPTTTVDIPAQIWAELLVLMPNRLGPETNFFNSQSRQWVLAIAQHYAESPQGPACCTATVLATLYCPTGALLRTLASTTESARLAKEFLVADARGDYKSVTVGLHNLHANLRDVLPDPTLVEQVTAYVKEVAVRQRGR